MLASRWCWLLVIALTILTTVGRCSAQEASAHDTHALSDRQSKRLDEAVDRALEWLSRTQQPDGSFPTIPTGQPGVTGLSALAFLSAGHIPGSQPHGDCVERAIRYSLRCEIKPGFFSLVKPTNAWQNDVSGHTGHYNQAIAGLLFAEVCGELSGELGQDVIGAAQRAVDFTTGAQFRKLPQRPIDEGGWRYPAFCGDGFTSDLSVTAWQVTFLRSAKNAGFDVDDEVIQAATKYVRGLYKPNEGTFTYAHRRISRGMTGAGIMSMAMLGQHHSEEAKAAATWLKRHPFRDYGRREGQFDRFQYSLYYCAQGMYHLGDEHFNQFLPTMVDVLVDNQRPNGSWPAVGTEGLYGDAYATAMSVLALTTHYAMLPIHQR